MSLGLRLVSFLTRYCSVLRALDDFENFGLHLKCAVELAAHSPFSVRRHGLAGNGISSLHLKIPTDLADDTDAHQDCAIIGGHFPAGYSIRIGIIPSATSALAISVKY
jgi:hypothetical protein